jgi:hypothetical protein
LSEEEYFGHYEALLTRNLRHLPINPDYLLYLLQSAEAGPSPRLEQTLAYYRDSLREFWEMSRRTPTYGGPFGFRVFSEYNRLLGTTLRACYMADPRVSPSPAGSVLAGLNAARHLPEQAGKEPIYLSALLQRVLFDVEPGTPSPLLQDTPQTFLQWLDETFQASGTDERLIDEAWRLMVKKSLDFYLGSKVTE